MMCKGAICKSQLSDVILMFRIWFKSTQTNTGCYNNKKVSDLDCSQVSEAKLQVSWDRLWNTDWLLPEAADTSQIHTLLSIDWSVCIWNGYASSFAQVTHNLVFSMDDQSVCAHALHASGVCECGIPTIQQQKPERVWLTRHWNLLFLGTEGCWSVRIPISSKQGLPVIHPDPLHPSHIAKHTQLPAFLFSRAFLFFSYGFSCKHCLSFSPSPIHKIPSCRTP